MKKITELKRFLMFALLSLLVLSCEKNDDGITERAIEQNLVATAQETDALSSLVAALIKADENEGTDLVATLSSDGPFTVFAPTNDAFAELLGGLENYNSLEDFVSEEDKELLATILTYHVYADGIVPSSELSDGQTITMIQGEDLEVKLDNGVFINDATGGQAQVIIPDIGVSNGIVHVIDKVLVPQAVIDATNNQNDSEEEGTLVDLVVEAENLSVLEAAVIKAGLVDTLNSEGPFTVLAPTDEAFVALLAVLGDNYNSLDDFDTEEELALLKDILLYHVIPAEVFEADLAPGTVPTALADNSLEIIASNDTFVIGDASDTNANISATDLTASNGVAHIIDKVLLPQSAIDFVASFSLKTIVEIAVETDDLSLLVEALQQANAGLVELLGTEGPFTVFAPTNEAFASLLHALGDNYNSLADFDTEDEKALLVDILTYHVVSGTAAFSGDLFSGQEIPTAQGETVGINITNGTVHVVDATDTNASVVMPDVEASNGVVHVINKVLLPQSALDFITSLSLKTIVEIAVETDDLSLLVEALVQANAGLVELLGTEGPFTVFAPDNHAFAALLDALGDDYHSLSDFDTEGEKALLVKVLTYHVVVGTAAFSKDLFDGQEIPTAQGESVKINISGSTVHIEDATSDNATVSLPDVEASNGVVHIIDKVLLPQEVLDLLAPKVPNIVELAQSVDDLSLLVDALIQADAGLVELLSSEGPFTVFAPTNHAFADLLNALGDDYHSLADFDTAEEKALLTKVLAYHVVAGAAVASNELSDHQELPTAQGESLFAIINHGVAIRDKTGTDANVTAPDNNASNGIVHIIDKVLLPQEVIDILNPPSH